MIPYAGTFLLSYILVYIAERRVKKKEKSIFALILILVVCVLLSVLAAIRDNRIGTDVLTYVNRYFKAATNATHFSDYIRMFASDSVEPIYFLINFITARFTDSVRVIYFIIELWDTVFVALFLWENRKNASMLLGFFVFTMMLYNISYNAVRQTMALCVCLYSFNAARDKRIKKYLLLMLLAFLIHRSSIIMIITYPLMRMFENKSSQRKDSLLILSILIAIAGLLFVNVIVEVLIKIGIFPAKFSLYVGMDYSLTSLGAFAYLVPILIIMFLYRKKLYEMDQMNAVMFLYLFVWPLFAQLDSVSDQFGRLAFGFMLSNISIYSQLPYLKTEMLNSVRKRNVNVLIIISIAFWMLYWYMNFCIWNVGQTYPYVLGI
jgi:hypothetical protein